MTLVDKTSDYQNPFLHPPVHQGKWTVIEQSDICCPVEAWWDSFVKWLSFTKYKQIHKIEILDVWLDGQPTADKSLIHFDDSMKKSRAQYRRRIYPKDYLRKPNIEDWVIHQFDLHRCEFAPILPKPDPKCCPYYYVQAYAFAFQLQVRQPHLEDTPGTETEATPKTSVTFEVIPFDDPLFHDIERLKKIAQFYFKLIEKWTRSYLAGGYVKRVHHDVVIPLDIYTENYRRLKEKYKSWVHQWPESTDASKYVHEDLGIASFIISLWSNPFDGEYSSTEYKPSFVDLGCGNGFLVNILANEGYTGYGIDLAKRKIWENYSPEVTLLQKSLDPLNDSFEQDWIIANHPDELTPWIPMIASRKNNKFFILPCCEYDFSSKYSAKGNIPKYASYLLYIKKIATICGYDVEVEHLRIPSTRNIAIIGRRRSVDISDSSVVESIEIAQRQCLADANFTKFVPREKKSRKHK